MALNEYSTAEALVNEIPRKSGANGAILHEKILQFVKAFPESTLQQILYRVRNGSDREKNLYADIAMLNDYKLNEGPATANDRRCVNVMALTSELCELAPWEGWDALRNILTDAGFAIEQGAEFEEMDGRRLRAAVLVNIVYPEAPYRDRYDEYVDYFVEHFDQIRESLPTLRRLHEDLADINLPLVENVVTGSVSLSSGVL